MKWKTTYRDMAWFLLGVFVGISVAYFIIYGYSIMFLNNINLNIGQVIVDINETNMVDHMYQLINST